MSRHDYSNRLSSPHSRLLIIVLALLPLVVVVKDSHWSLPSAPTRTHTTRTHAQHRHTHIALE